MGRLRRPDCFQHHVGRPSTAVPFTTSPFSSTTQSSSPQCLTAPGHQGVFAKPPLTKDHKENLFSSTPSFLPSLYCAQERRSQPPYHRPLHIEQMPHYSVLQDGKGVFDRLLHCGPYVGLHYRPAGRLLPRPYGLALPHVPGFCGRQSDLCLPGTSLWPFSRPLGILQNHETYQSPPSPFIVPFSHIPGRFPGTCYYPRGPPREHLLYSFPPKGPGTSYQYQKVQTVPISDHRVLGGHITSGQAPSFYSTQQGFGDRVTLPGHNSSPTPLSSSTRERCGSSQLCLVPSTSGQTSSETHCLLDEHPHVSGVQRCPSSYRSAPQGPSSDMDRPRVSEDSSSYVSSLTYPPADDRCITVGLGRGFDSLLHDGDMALFLPVLLNKLAGTQGRFSISSTLPSSHPRSVRPTPFRQHYSHSLHFTSRHTQVGSPHDSYGLPPRVLFKSLHLSDSQTSEWLLERPGRSRLPSRPRLHGMGPGPGNLLLAMLSVQHSTGRPVCHSGEPPASRLCLSVPRPRRSRDQCVLNPMGSLGLNLSLSSCTPSSQSLLPPPSVSGPRGTSCSILCSVKLAHKPPPQVSGPNSSSGGPFSVAEDQQRQGPSPRPFCISASRVETIKQGLLKSGFNSAAADVYLLSLRESSTRQYQSIWRKFLSFLSRNDISHRDTSVGVVCNWLTYEAIVNNLTYRTLTGYRSALKIPLFWGCNLEIKTVVSDQFLRGLYNLKPPLRAAPMPIWNINVVLSYLQSDKFEPLESASFDSLAQKTLFLILLASGRRISEVANLSRLHSEDSSGLSLTLEWVPQFRPKHDDPGFQPPFPSISYLATDRSQDLFLCPIRAYYTFLSISQPWAFRQTSQGQHPLLWAHPTDRLPLNVRKLTKLFINLVRDALRDAGLPFRVKIGPHQMRKFAASLSIKHGQNEDIVRELMGFSSVNILRKNYVAGVPPLNIACVLPGGPYFPQGTSGMSDTDSD